MERELIKEKGGNLVAWETVQQPKEKGGLGGDQPETTE